MKPTKKQALDRRFRWAVEYTVLLGVVRLFERLSPAVRMAISRTLGRLAVRALPIRREIIREQLEIAFPERSADDRERMIPAIYANLFAFGQEVMAMRRAQADDLRAMVEVHPDLAARIQRALAEKKGFIITTGHMGNWEYAGAALCAMGARVTAAAKPMHNPWSEKFIMEARERWGMKIVSTRGSMAPLVRALRSGGIVGLVADQDARSGGVFVDFFGKKASTAMGPAWLAWRLGVPIIPVNGFRGADGRLRYEAGPEITPDPKAPEAEEVLRITSLYVKSLEDAIRRDPSQYFWFHRRWKTRPKSERGRSRPASGAKSAQNPAPADAAGEGLKVGNF